VALNLSASEWVTATLFLILSGFEKYLDHRSGANT
jgi:hypothetical protein